MYVRILVLVAFVGPALVPRLWWRLVALAVVGAILALNIRGRDGAVSEGQVTTLQNPFEIRPALIFAAVFVLLLVVTSWVRNELGTAGTLALSLVVGVADVDPFILSVAGGPGTDIAITAIVLATMSNTAAKGVYLCVLAPAARRQAAWRYAAWTFAHLPLAFLP
jgi:uncharacterized membrane protein (DUF4010 family)